MLYIFYSQNHLYMVTLLEEVEKMEEKQKQLGKLVLHKEKEALVPPTAMDLVFIDDASLLRTVTKRMKHRGFLMLHSAGQTDASASADLLLVSTRTSKDFKLSLFRKTTPVDYAVTHVRLQQRDSRDFEWVPKLQKVMREVPITDSTRIYVSSQGQPPSGILGFVKCLLQEEGTEHIRCILDPENELDLNFEYPSTILLSIIENDLVLNVVRNGKVGSYSHLPIEILDTKTSEHAFVSALVPGDLSSLSWVEAQVANPSYSMQEGTSTNVKIAYAPLNFRDALLAAAAIPTESKSSYNSPHLGCEFSGWDINGNRVMGIAGRGLLATSGWVDPTFVWPVPANWTLKEAATIPVAYSTAFYALHMKGRIQPGQSVLIHAGTGGTGQAAISIALAHECEVFTTVGTQEKRMYMNKLFPQIQDDHIGSSRDTSFEEQFLQVTNGRGMDIILNSLEGEKLMAGIRCLTPGGKFIEIGVQDAAKNTPLGMRVFLKSIEFIRVVLQNLLTFDRKHAETLKSMIADGVAGGTVRPLCSSLFQPDKVEEAFRFIASGRHMGKVLVKIRDEDSAERHVTIPALPRTYFIGNKAYIVVGGLGGFGLEVTNWMIERGARHLTIPSRSGVTNGYQSLCLRKWKITYGITVATPIVDLSKKEYAEDFLRNFSTAFGYPEVGGIFNCAMILKDAEFLCQTEKSFAEVAEPKAVLMENLDAASRKYCRSLDYFVAFSSTSSGYGNSGQANYGWSNSVMERICEKRVAEGLCGLAIQWGYIGQVGYLAEKITATGTPISVFAGLLPQNIGSCLRVLDAALRQQENGIISSFATSPKEKNAQTRRRSGDLMSRVKHIFGIKDLNLMSPNRKLTGLGLDSMITFELRQIIEVDFGISLTRDDVRKLTIGGLKAIEAGKYIDWRDKYATQNQNMEGRCLIQLESMGSKIKPTMFLVHGTGGGVEIFRPVAQKLDFNIFAYKLHHGVDVTTTSALAEDYIQACLKSMALCTVQKLMVSI